MPDAATEKQVESLIDVREDDGFKKDKRDVAAALVYARPYADSETFKNREEANGAADAIKALKNAVKDAGEQRKNIKAPYLETERHIDMHYKELLAQAEAAIGVLTRKGVAFQRAERAEAERRQREEKARLDKLAEKAAEEASAAAVLAEEEPESSEAQQLAAETHREAAVAAVATPPPATPPKQLRGDFAKLGTRTDYHHELVDLSKVPDEDKILNEKSVKAKIKAERAVAKAQGRDFNLQLIPGVRIWTEEVGVS